MRKFSLIVNTIAAIVIITIVLTFPATAFAQENSLKPLVELMNIFLNLNAGTMQQSSFNVATPSPTSILYPPPLSSTLYPLPSNLIYYPQCDGNFDNLSFPNGCNLCQSGCGPATTAMILSSYIDKKFTPAVVVDLFKEKGLYAGCNGTKITDNQKLINEVGLKTTDLLFYRSNEEAVADFKAYLEAGWTMFALARFCENGCRHYFWITDIDEASNVWAYDPFYGRKELPPPFNENKYYPFPRYRLAFGVKKL